MWQKRQLFQKQIRRQKMNDIFRKRRQFKFNYKYQGHQQKYHSADQIEKMKLQCTLMFNRFDEEVRETTRLQNFEDLLAIMEESHRKLKAIIKKSKGYQHFLQYVLETWFELEMDQLIIGVVKFLEQVPDKRYNVIKKQITKYAISQFYTIFEYQLSVKVKPSRKQIFRFLFIATNQLSNLPQSIHQILVILNSTLQFNKQARHQFFFLNKATQKQVYNCSKQQPQVQQLPLITFQNLSFTMFSNREKFYHLNNEEQNEKYDQIKLNYVLIFKEYAYELKYMEAYIEREKKKNHNQLFQNQILSQKQIIQNSINETTLKLHGHPSEIKLSNFISKEVLTFVIQTIEQMLTFYLNNWEKSQTYQEYLADYLEAYRMFIQFYPSKKLLDKFEDRLATLVDLLIVANFNIITKHEILNLIDMVIYLNEDNSIVQRLVKYNNLFSIVWSQYNYDAKVKYNIINNLLLSPSGYREAEKYMSQIVIELKDRPNLTKLILTFVMHYFSQKSYYYNTSPNDELVLDLLWDLQPKTFEVEDVKMDMLILIRLFQKDLRKKLPTRYKKWSYKVSKADDDSSQNQKFILAQKMEDLHMRLQKSHKNSDIFDMLEE